MCLKTSDKDWSSISTMQATISVLIGIIDGFHIENRRSPVSMAYLQRRDRADQHDTHR